MAKATAEPNAGVRPRVGRRDRNGPRADADAGGRLRGFLNRLFEPVDIASIVVFRTSLRGT